MYKYVFGGRGVGGRMRDDRVYDTPSRWNVCGGGAHAGQRLPRRAFPPSQPTPRTVLTHGGQRRRRGRPPPSPTAAKTVRPMAAVGGAPAPPRRAGTVIKLSQAAAAATAAERVFPGRASGHDGFLRDAFKTPLTRGVNP